MERAELAKARAARCLALLWAGTCALFLFHPQGAVPLVGPAEAAKLVSAGPGILACLAVLLFPASRAALAAAFAASGYAVLAWHSWLGAYQPLVPAGFLFLLVFRRSGLAEARNALFEALCLGLLAGAAHRLNSAFLAGAEFAPGGTLSRDLPGFLLGPAGILGGPVPWSLAWLVSGVAPLLGFALGRRFGWILLALGFFFSLVLYKVLFYGFFLAVPALFLADPAFLQRWKAREHPVRPLHLYLAGLAVFLLWYLLGRDLLWPYLAAVALGFAAVAGSRFEPEPAPPASRGRASAFWGGAWLLYLLLPFFLPSIPEPFALTQFSARHLRFPPAHTTENWRGYQGCGRLKNDYALRWGYRLWQEAGTCKLQLYRILP